MNPTSSTQPSGVTFRPARVDDVPAMIELIEYWAAQGKMLKRALPTVFENLKDFVVAERRAESRVKIVGTAALHVLWSDIAEVRCLAVHPDEQGGGIGRQLVRTCEQEAQQLGVSTVFAWTLSVGFFEKCGYGAVGEAELHPRVQAGCRHCPFSQGCHENGMAKHLSAPKTPFGAGFLPLQSPHTC